jgi:hypothetical protein
LKRLLYLILTVLLLIILLPPVAGAEENLSLEVQPGFDAFYKVDTWTPVRVTVANQGPDLQAELRIRDDNVSFGLSNVLYVYPIDLPGQSRKQLTLYVPLRGQRRLVVELVEGEGTTLLSEPTSVAALKKEDLLVGVIASDPSLLNRLAQLKTTGGNRVAVAHLQLDALPTNPRAWTGLDILVFNDVDTAPLTAAQQDALNSWLGLGGRLVVGGGPNAAQTISGLETLLPFSDLTLQTLPHPLSALQNFVRTPLEDRGPYVTAVPSNVTGRVLSQENNWPLIVVTGYGRGQVYYLALDLSLAPLDMLAAQPQFLPRLMGPLQPRRQLAENVDLYQMRDSLALVPDQTLPKPGAVALYLIIYILVMGPANYFVLRRMKRREWAWFSIPLIILLFSGYGYFSGFRLRGGRSLLRQITVIQAEMGAPLSNADSFIGVYSPFRADYNLEIDGPVLVESLGSYGVSSELTVTASESTIVQNLRGDIGGMPAIVAHSHTTLPQIMANLSYHRTDHRFYGNINNNTGQPITHALLVMSNEVLELGTLPPGPTEVDGIATPRYAYDSLYARDYDRDDPRQAIALASRDAAVRAMFNFNDYYYAELQPPPTAGLYLAGWQEGSSIEVTLTNTGGDKMSDTLLLVGLPFVAN